VQKHLHSCVISINDQEMLINAFLTLNACA